MTYDELFPSPESGAQSLFDHLKAANDLIAERGGLAQYVTHELSGFSVVNGGLAAHMQRKREVLRRYMTTGTITPFTEMPEPLRGERNLGPEDTDAYFLGVLCGYSYCNDEAVRDVSVDTHSLFEPRAGTNNRQLHNEAIERLHTVFNPDGPQVPQHVYNDLLLPTITATRVGMAGAVSAVLHTAKS